MNVLFPLLSIAPHPSTMSNGSRRLCVGYALASKKQQSLLQPSLLDHLKAEGIELVEIDPESCVTEQGPFDVILHKMTGDLWNRELKEYRKKQPEVIVVDPPESIERLHSRASMLEAVKDLQLSSSEEEGSSAAILGIPNQAVVFAGGDINQVRKSFGLKFPLIAKPLLADGSATSHSMSLAFNLESLSKLQPPLVLQEFINHGGVIFKVYVVGDSIECVKRKSLPDIHEHDLAQHQFPLLFSQISNISSCGSADLPDVDLPEAKFISDIASGLRRALGLRLFNFDLIRDSAAGNRYYIVDINYFPGYAKMPSYESAFVHFFLSLGKEIAQ